MARPKQSLNHSRVAISSRRGTIALSLDAHRTLFIPASISFFRSQSDSRPPLQRCVIPNKTPVTFAIRHYWFLTPFLPQPLNWERAATSMMPEDEQLLLPSSDFPGPVAGRSNKPAIAFLCRPWVLLPYAPDASPGQYRSNKLPISGSFSCAGFQPFSGGCSIAKCRRMRSPYSQNLLS